MSIFEKKCKEPVKNIFCFIFCIFISISSVALAGQSPRQVSMTIHINKIYNVNALNKTYSIDGYMVTKWQDDNVFPHLKLQRGKNQISFENQDIRDKLFELYPAFWLPTLEFINVVNSRNIPNKRIVITKGLCQHTAKNTESENSSCVMYNERFNAIFYSNMDFKKFPFDEQFFLIKIEPFSKNNKSLVFVDSKQYTDIKNDTCPNINTDNSSEPLMVEFDVNCINNEVVDVPYPHLGDNVKFSRFTLKIRAKRISTFYFWQFILPLFLIIGASWAVFWIKDFEPQLSTAFTLMLTVVAFSFSISTILPRLPYSSFLDSLVILGYLSIFVTIIFIIANHFFVQKDNIRKYLFWVNLFRWLMPTLVTLMVLLLVLLFFLFD